VISRVRDRFGIEMPLRTLFENPTIAELCVAMQAVGSDTISMQVPLVPVNRQAVRVKRTHS
jgi:Phosphopantetheine attachment site